MKEKKTVIILGAGFSISANIPKQDDLLIYIDTYYSSKTTTCHGKAEWIEFKKLFKKIFGNNIKNYLIEDVFTVFDKCLIDEESFKGSDTTIIRQGYNNLLSALKYYLIDIVNDGIATQKGNYKKYSDFALLLLRKRKEYGIKKDKISLISLNWDSYFERTIVNKLTNYRKYGLDIDYCTFDFSMENSGSSTPSILKHAKKKLNLKYLKPHGSTNWGICPNCGRLYISYGKKIEDKFECIKFCNPKYKKVKLSPVLVTPTFIKDISNTHISGIWQNIGIELSEATKIIFIGYSLRPEDYYFRYMLSKYIDKMTSIFVFDYLDKTKPPDYQDKMKKDIQSKFNNFFQQCIVHPVDFEGWENSLKKIQSILDK